MSTALYSADLVILNQTPSLPLVARWSVAFAVVVTKWDARRRTRKHLSRLSEYHLRDIGIDPFTARAEITKKFWQE